jgi:hypothetical protein
MASPTEANFDEAALEAELEALHMSRYNLRKYIAAFSSPKKLLQPNLT